METDERITCQITRRTFIERSSLLMLSTALGQPGGRGLDLHALLRPVQAHSVLRSPDWFIWGGGMVRTPDGTCHLLFARWEKKHGFNAWVTHSQIAYATAPDPLGPFQVQGTALGMEKRPGFWDADNLHNPLIQAFEGKYYLYYSGNYGDGQWWTHRNNQRAGVAVADHPAGPWRRSDKPLIEPTPGGTDHLLTNSPTVARRRDGRYVLIYKGVSDGKMPFGGKVRMHVALGDTPSGPFEKQHVTVFGHETAQFPTDDNFIWAQDGQLYAIVKDYGGHYSKHGKEVLLLFESRDGLKWKVARHDLVSKFEIAWADGRKTGPLHRLDQPQVWLENGQPKALFLAVKEKPDKDDTDLSYNIHLGLGKS
jgi:hypothetical protein